MNEKNDLVQIRINSKDKKKAMFVLKCKGEDLSSVLRKVIDEYAQEYDNIKKEMQDV